MNPSFSQYTPPDLKATVAGAALLLTLLLLARLG